jgi:acyl-CoA synthetase (AMP-forming)/AMP-acid ligase II
VTNLAVRMEEAAGARPASRFLLTSEARPCTLTLADVVADGRCVAAGLRLQGVQPGDIVGVMLPSGREWLLMAVACAFAGAVMLPIVTIFGPSELGFILRQSRAKMLVTPDAWRGRDFGEIVAGSGPLPGLVHVVVGSGVSEWQIPFGTLEGVGDGLPTPGSADDALAMLIYTSGTTSAPKGVRHSHATLLAELDSQAMLRGADEVLMSPWPPGHIAGALALLRFLVHGVPVIAMEQWEPTLAARLVEQYRVTNSSGTPLHLGGIIEAAAAEGRDLSSLETYVVGAAPVPPALVERAIEAGISVVHCYGSTEHPTVTLGVPGDSLEKRLGTEGRVIRGSEIRIVDEGGRDVPQGTDGEIATRGPERFLGYLDPALDAAAFLPGGWYLTGDIGRLNEDGYLLVTDRKKDIVIRGGENISSREVEEVLLHHPAVVEAAVVGAPHERLGEIVMAWVVLMPGTHLSLQEVRAHFGGMGVARQKTPERLELVDLLPRNASGKILKQELRARARHD